jgi:transcriptional regulator with XRE-family HTH domain
MSGSQYVALTEAIKIILKRKGMTYSELAAQIGMSESGIKKLLGAEDGTVGRLESICQCLGISLLDLVQTPFQEMPTQEIRFSAEVQNYLVENETCFGVYWALVYEEVPSARVPGYLGISDAEFWRQVRQLDRLGLLVAGPDQHIRLPRRGNHLWVGDGPLMRHLRATWTRALLDEVIPTAQDDSRQLSLRLYRLTAASTRELRQALEKLLREFSARNLHERLVCEDSQLTPMRLMIASAPGGFLGKNSRSKI